MQIWCTCLSRLASLTNKAPTELLALQNVQRYQALSAGAEPVESQLQDMLVEYLNAEISLQTVKDITQAVQVCGRKCDGCSRTCTAWDFHITYLTTSPLTLHSASLQWLKTTFLAVRVRPAKACQSWRFDWV